MRTCRLLTLGLASSLSLGGALGCGTDRAPELQAARFAIVGGESTGAEQQMVVRVFGSPPPGTGEVTRACTGTLIAPNLVVTALHCLSPLAADGNFTCTLDGELADPPSGTLGTPVEASHVGVSLGADFKREPDARGTQLLTTRSTQICQNDLAFIVLDRALDAPLAPVRIDRRVQIAEQVTVVGYGLTTDPPTPAGEVTQRRWRTGLRVVAVEQDGREKSRPRTFALGESVCMGDSGGPALSEQGAVLGVYSTNLAGCAGSGARNFFTMLSGFRPLVLDAYAAAGATPWLEGEPEPGSVLDPDPPEETLDAGPLVPYDSPPDDVPSSPRPPSKRVDSGFCSAGPARQGGLGGVAVLGAALLGLSARRRRA